MYLFHFFCSSYSVSFHDFPESFALTKDVKFEIEIGKVKDN